MNRESIFEPQRGGIVLARADAAPTELGLEVEGAWCYKDIAPMELGAKLAGGVGQGNLELKRLNFGTRLMKDGIKRILNGLPEANLGALAALRETQNRVEPSCTAAAEPHR